MNYDFNEKMTTIKSHWKEFYPADRGKGKYKGIICPLCNSGSGSHGTGITENPHKLGQLHCWSCGFSGDIIDLIKQDQHLDTSQAIHYAMDKLDIVATNTNPQNYSQQKEYNKTMNQPIAQTPTSKNYTTYYEQCQTRLCEPDCVAYLRSRGISLETAQQQGLGYDPEWKSPSAVAKNPQNANKIPTSRRLIVPFSSESYHARDISNTSKYVKMNEGQVGFVNEESLYDAEHKYVFVVEGFFDALSLIEKGYSAVSLNSTSNATKLVEQLKTSPTTAHLLIALDNDSTGKNTAQNLLKQLQEIGIKCSIANPADTYKDANEFLQKEPARFEQHLQALMQKIELANADRPDSTSFYIENFLSRDIQILRENANKKTGFADLDHKAGNLNAGLYVLAATPSLGKTTLALQIADNLAQLGQDVIFFSLEQSKLELVSKSMCREIALEYNFQLPASSQQLRNGAFGRELLQAVEIYKTKIGNHLSIVEGNFNCNVDYIRNYVKKYIKRTSTKPIIFIDYLQILESANHTFSTRRDSVDEAVKALKQMSRAFGITVFVISSVNRTNYMTTIDFESLKESGGIEYTADVIWGLQLTCLNEACFSGNDIQAKRERIREEKSKSIRKIDLVCLKNRYGCSNFVSSFDYSPQFDYFSQTLEPAQPTIKKKIRKTL